MDHLPDELLLQIIKYINIKSSEELEDLKSVSKRFHILCNDYSILLGIIQKLEDRCKELCKCIEGMENNYHDNRCSDCGDSYFCQRCYEKGY